MDIILAIITALIVYVIKAFSNAWDFFQTTQGGLVLFFIYVSYQFDSIKKSIREKK